MSTTILLPEGDRHLYAAAWAGLGEVQALEALGILPADSLVLRVAAGALPGPHVLSRLSDARTDDRPASARTVPIEPDEPACVLCAAGQLRAGVEPEDGQRPSS
ncbi:hypothetical protein [Nocardioides sp. InS609-2]|uniref:hypothetical protein n=1 Tax=Nocardioides sp. InS609-2 TaxID=2760705 RepID=UPI0020BE6DE1|nr:hypothetical protein [Nocardioides sp. InS609-2]